MHGAVIAGGIGGLDLQTVAEMIMCKKNLKTPKGQIETIKSEG